MNKDELQLCVKIIINTLGAIKSECEGKCNCNSCLLIKECCLFDGVPSQWDLDLIENRIRKILEIESKIKKEDQEYEYT